MAPHGWFAILLTATGFGLGFRLSAQPAAQDVFLAPTALAASRDGSTLWVGCERTAEVLRVRAADGAILRRVALPGPASGLALAPDESVLFATCGGPTGWVCRIALADDTLIHRVRAGYQAQAPLLSPDGNTLIVCNRFDHDLSLHAAEDGTLLRRIPVSREPFSVAATPDGRWLLVAHHLHAGRADLDEVRATVGVVELATGRLTAELALPNGSTLVRDIRIAPDGRHAFVAHILARFHLPTTQIERGWINTNAGTLIALTTPPQVINTVLLDEVDSGAATPWAVAWTPDSARVVVTHAGTHEISEIQVPALLEKLAQVPVAADARPPPDYTSATRIAADVPNDLSFLVKLRRRVRLSGQGPRALAVAGDRAWVAQYFSDTLEEVDLSTQPPRVRSLPLGEPPQTTAARLGERHFNDARLCFQGWQACSSCHSHDARVDALNWDNLNDGIGNPKNAKSLVHSHLTPPMMWLGVRSNMQVAVRAGIRNSLFTVQPPEVAEQIDAYFMSLRPQVAPRVARGDSAERIEMGRALFHEDATRCAHCHRGSPYTDLQRHDVGTRSRFDQPTDRFDTPTLLELWRSGPYLHDGSAATLRDVLTTRNAAQRHGRTAHLTPEQIEDLVAFLESL
jgi:DNA-binding beta-propeller fold protein YncE